MRQQVRVPQLGEGIESVDVVSVLVEAGDTVEVDQPLIEVETEKASVEVPTTHAGTIAEVLVSPGDGLSEGDVIAVIESAGQTQAAAPVPAPPAEAEPTLSAPADEPPPDEEVGMPDRAPRAPAPPSPPRLRPIPAAPSVRRFAREIGVDIARVDGTGARGRISVDDVKGYASELLAHAARAGTDRHQPDLPDFSVWGEVVEEPMSRVRRVTAESMARAWTTVAQVTNHELADITELEEQRRHYRDRVASAGGKLTMTAILVKVAASALRVHAKLNASLDLEREVVVFKHYVHVGVAVDTEHGLLVPVIRDADRKNVCAIAAELGDLADRARSRKLAPDEMHGASFTITNLGGIGGTAFTPIVNWPQVAILGVSRASMQPRWVGGELRPRLVLPLSLSYDHRLVDGADAARFLAWLSEALARPLLVLLEG